jgi:hypothetical protein
MRGLRGFWRGCGGCAWLAGVAAVGVLVVPASAAAQTPIPPSLLMLEQKMAQIRFSTVRVATRVVFGEVGPGGGGAELGTGVQGPNAGFVTSTVGVFRLSPPKASTTSKVEAAGVSNGKGASSVTSRVRVIGDSVYTYTPSALRYDRGRPWVRSKQSSSSASDGEVAIPKVLDSSAPFAKLIEDVNGALSVQEVGPMTVDGQPVTEFTASLTMATLLPGKQLERFAKDLSSLASLGEILSPGKESPKQREAAKSRSEADIKKVSELPVEIELFIAPSGLPVRANTVIGNRNEAIGSELDILALEVPVDVHAPPASETVSQAELRKLRARRVCSIVRVHAASAQPVICSRKSTRARSST